MQVFKLLPLFAAAALYNAAGTAAKTCFQCKGVCTPTNLDSKCLAPTAPSTFTAIYVAHDDVDFKHDSEEELFNGNKDKPGTVSTCAAACEK